jgi:hypothetical protein
MNIAWIGGITRNEAEYEREAARRGHQLETHDGHTAGRGAETLRRAIERADVVVALTEINSHGAVTLSRAYAAELGRPFVLLRKCGIAHFRTLLEALSNRQAYVGATLRIGA